MRTLHISALAAAALVALGSSVRAQDHIDTVYGNNASFGPDTVDQFSVDITAGTASLVKEFVPSGGNGRGVVVLNNVMYSTVVGDNHIYKTDVNTGLSLGSILVPAVTSLSTIAWDGKNFWASDYAGTDHAFEIDTSGNLLQTITLNQSSGFFDGMEIFNTGSGDEIVANRGDAQGPYDVYAMGGGNALIQNFLAAGTGNSSSSSTGVAFDGTYFLTSNIFNSSLSVWTSSGAYVETISLPPGTSSAGNLVEDLSVNYNLTLNKAPDAGSTIALFVAALLGVGLVRRRIAAA